MKVKLLSLIIALAMVASLFVACNQPTNNESSGGESNNESSSGEQTEDVELIWYQWGTAPNDAQTVYDELNKMSKEALGITVDFRFADDQKAKLIVSTNEKYDIIYSCSWQNNYVQQAGKGYFADITEKVKTVTPDLYDFIPETVWKGMEVQGKIYAIPTFKDSSKQDFWNTKKFVLDGIGWTEQQFKDLLSDQMDPAVATPFVAEVQKWLDENGPTKSGITNAFMLDKNGYGFRGAVDYVTRSGTDIVISLLDDPKDGVEVMPVWAHPDTVKYQNVLHEWVKAGYVNKDAPTLESNAAGSVFAIGQGWENCEPFWYDNVHDSPAVIAPKEQAHITTDTVQGSAQAISANSTNVDAALKYLQYCNLDEKYRNTFNYGIEGVHWNMLPEGNVERTEEGRTNYMPGTFSQATFFTLYNEAPVPAGAWEELKNTVENAIESPILGFVPDVTPIETQLGVIGNVQAKWAALINSAVEEPGPNIDACLEEMYASGLQEIVDELQKQVDEFLANKQ